MTGVGMLAALAGALAAWGIAEQAVHTRRLRRIPVRIHVNGTRGKSSVTRLIAAGLRDAGLRTFAKTTGTLPRFILPNGRELAVHRAARANVLEQRGVVERAASQGAEALVLECMALQPELQWLSEAKLVRATHGVITNVRPDHLAVMGPTDRDVGLALAGMVPVRGKLFTPEVRHLDILEAACADRGTTLHHVDVQAARVTEEDLAAFSYHEHAENVALALAICADVGVERAAALRGMWAAKPDPGALTEHELLFFGRRLVFINGFAANDPVSTEQIWRMSLDRHPDVHNRMALFNCRADRPERSLQLARAYVQWPQAEHVLLIGSGAYIFAREAVGLGLDPTHLVFAEGEHADEVFETILGLAGRSALIVGMGNIGGLGLPLATYYANRARIA